LKFLNFELFFFVLDYSFGIHIIGGFWFLFFVFSKHDLDEINFKNK